MKGLKQEINYFTCLVIRMRINKVKLFVNDTEKSNEVLIILKEALIKRNIEIVEEDFDLGIAIGGDGTFLRMITDTNFNTNVYYVGINSGTLGFAQDIGIEEIDDFIDCLKKDNFNYEEISIQEVEIVTKEETFNLKSLNEILIRDDSLKTVKFDIYINGELLEKFKGDGILVSTSFGSTAYNLNLGGSIVYNTFDTLQITPIAPQNNKVTRSLTNSVIIPSNNKVTIIPNKDNSLLLMVDGNNYIFDNILEVNTVIKDIRIKLIRKDNYNFIRKINDKFLT